LSVEKGEKRNAKRQCRWQEYAEGEHIFSHAPEKQKVWEAFEKRAEDEMLSGLVTIPAAPVGTGTPCRMGGE
jgi:hypothetical protein